MLKRIYSFLSASRHDILVLGSAMFNRHTPKFIKTITIASLIYLISPIDFLPDMIPGIGLLDDAVIVPSLLYTMLQILPPQVRQASEARADYLTPKMPYILAIAAVFFIGWTIFVLYAIYNLIFN